MSSTTSNLGISPVLLLAVNQSLTTKSKDKAPSNCPTKLPQSISRMENKNANQELIQNMISQANSNGQIVLGSSDEFTNNIKVKTEISSTSDNEDLSNSERPVSGTTISDFAMANVLTTLAAQSQVFHIQDQTPVTLAKASLDQSLTLPKSAETVTSIFKLNTTKDSTLSKQKAQIHNGSSSQFTIVKPDPCKTVSERKSSVSPRANTDQESIKSDTASASPALNSDAIKTLLKMRIAMQGAQGGQSPTINPVELVENQSVSQSKEANAEEMVNVLSSLASQQITNGSVVTISDPTVEVGKDMEQNRFIISYDQETGAPQVQGIIVSDGVAQVIDQSGNRLLIQSSESVSGESEHVLDQTTNDQGDAYSTEPLDLHSGSNVTVYTDPNAAPALRSPCPICGDSISGFHYGIFTCESCKGFFKRTVQNKKTFLCHRQGECEINLDTRKKCPACRFAKCLVMGMKLEAIRADRTRGGRSNYTGTPPGDPSKMKNVIPPIERKKAKLMRRSSSVGTFQDNPESSQGSSHLMAVLNNGDVVGELKPLVPHILTDIMSLESLLCDDDIPQEIGGDRLDMSDPSVFLTFLQLAELKLYKIVRWARNLPYFANISTDDQILLLQNCWCELLSLIMCWKSMQLYNEVIFFHGQSIDEEKATTLGIGDLFQSFLALIDHMRRLHLDQYECVALKVIILICPDMKGLKDADKLAEQQQRISGALETYTNSHYRQSPNKFGELILRLSELSRISFVLKGHLVKWMPPNSTSCGLLFELLKGENMKDLV